MAGKGDQIDLFDLERFEDWCVAQLIRLQITPTQLAKVIGLHPVTLHHIRTGKKQPSLRSLALIAQRSGKPIGHWLRAFPQGRRSRRKPAKRRAARPGVT